MMRLNDFMIYNLGRIRSKSFGSLPGLKVSHSMNDSSKNLNIDSQLKDIPNYWNVADNTSKNYSQRQERSGSINSLKLDNSYNPSRLFFSDELDSISSKDASKMTMRPNTASSSPHHDFLESKGAGDYFTSNFNGNTSYTSKEPRDFSSHAAGYERFNLPRNEFVGYGKLLEDTIFGE